MLRSGLIALFVALIVADPYVCAVADPCSDCPTTEVADACDHSPAQPPEDACQSCFCKGATAPTNRMDVVADDSFLVAVEPPAPLAVLVADYWVHARHIHLGQPVTGRTVRILIASFLA